MARVAVVGATGAVGQQLLSILAARKFPVTDLIAFASARSLGKDLQYAGRKVPCQVMKPGCFDGIDFAFFDASDAVSKEWVPQAAASGAWTIDNSATFRMDPQVPLVVPEVNGHEIKRRQKIYAGPNCSTVQLVVALKPIHDRWRLKRVVVSSYQSVSGAGLAAIDELRLQTGSVLSGANRVEAKAFQHQIAFNCIPQIGGFKDDAYTSEEQKIIAESRKILGIPGLRVTATAVRVPTLSCHGESVNIETEKPFDVVEVRRALAGHAGIIVQDDPAKHFYPMGVTSEGSPVESASGRDAVYVGRIRRDESLDNGLNLWIVSDNLRKGAALNAVQIGEYLVSSAR